ncbi:ROK family transcriptional regulator [Pullulanibacillus sp. KACC 23026]|uniref:ROK family transcriptional regulator n=1 Tax=Pullulanibacillus sp. KACC 23026 TaxID=3028315 RepID=UPI0023AF8384|nr:ROK family transcriptional regulator [Pullulanibacillus sp. KACC 23026]WEG10764.1 ROK family transcriptional regulator [Pullulanibacillus sp. KACC 23026]
MNRRTGDLKFMQEINRSIVFDFIRKHGPISRIEIAKSNNLSPTTVTSAVNELIKNGFVEEGETGVSNGGRRPVLLKFSPNKRTIIGVSIRNTMIEIGELNLEPKVLQVISYPVDNLIGEDFISYLLECLEYFLSEISDLHKCIGISIVAPGIVDYKNGILRYNSALELIEIPLRDMVENRFKIKTHLENDTNSIALAEKELGEIDEYKDLFYIMVGDGLGAGVVINNSIYRGNQGGAGEFGHFIVERGGILCDCGSRGCLGNYVGWPYIYSRIISAISRKKKTQLAKMAKGDLNKITLDKFFKAVDEGDVLAVNILDDVVDYLSTGIINIVNLLNPEIIIIGGVLGASDTLVAKLRDRVISQGLSTNTHDLDIRSTALGKDFMLCAAANLVLHESHHIEL